jgi:hypothetical protein
MGEWVHTESVSYADLIDGALARAKDPDPWANTPKDETLFRGLMLARAIVVAKFSGTVIVTPRSETNPVSTVTMAAGSALPAGERGEAVRLLMQTTAIYSQGRVDASDIQTTSAGGDVGVWPIVVGVCVVGLGAMATLGYCVHEYREVVDNERQRQADMLKLKQADAQAIEVLKRHTDREAQAGKQLPLDDASRSILDALSKMQSIIANKQSVDPPSPPGSGIGLTEIEIGAAVVLAAILLLKFG